MQSAIATLTQKFPCLVTESNLDHTFFEQDLTLISLESWKY
jgi:hypothetical protein